MNIPETVILKFFRGECNEEEEQQVKLYFIKNPGKLEKYMTEESWAETSSYVMPGSLTADMLEKIESKTYKPVVVKMNHKWMAAAAVLVVILGAAWIWQQESGKVDRKLAAKIKTTDGDVQGAFVTRTNTTGSVMQVGLKDGSVIELEAGSSISFHEPIINNRRDLFLQGNALFRPVTNKTQPFTVRAGNTATTALGTVFRVQEDKNGRVQVRLYSGRVMVKPVATQSQGNDSSVMVYLNPGQEVVFDNKVSMPLVKAFTEKTEMEAAACRKSGEATATLKFSNEPLKVIFEKLQKNKHIIIRYNDAELQDMSFTGIYVPAKETVDSFIETIALLNGLSVKKEKNIYYINR
jgi:ferric-dicitrate binding protein FerR (iron transport regulator)